MTFARNVARCEKIHGVVPKYDQLSESIGEEGPNMTELAHCITHNADKIDRRFFGYYSSQKESLVKKYAYP
jgi:predicted secreted Zn-dependent protease